MLLTERLIVNFQMQVEVSTSMFGGKIVYLHHCNGSQHIDHALLFTVKAFGCSFTLTSIGVEPVRNEEDAIAYLTHQLKSGDGKPLNCIFTYKRTQ